MVKKRKTRIGRLRVVQKSVKGNLFLARWIGGRVIVRANRRRRRRRGVEVDLLNFYFVKGDDPTTSGMTVPLRVGTNPQRKRTRNRRRTGTRHFHVGTAGPSVFPTAVVTVSTVRIASECKTIVTDRGAVPEDFDPITAARSVGGFGTCGEILI